MENKKLNNLINQYEAASSYWSKVAVADLIVAELKASRGLTYEEFLNKWYVVFSTTSLKGSEKETEFLNDANIFREQGKDTIEMVKDLLNKYEIERRKRLGRW